MKFRFETILRINKNREDLLLKELGAINTHLQKQDDRRHFMESASKNSREELNQKLRQNIDINTLMLYDNFFNGVKIQSARQKDIVSEIYIRLEAKRREVVEAGRKRRTMELLKEKDSMKFLKSKMKKDTFQMDEIASNMWQRNV